MRNSTVVVTGAASGIGRAIVEEAARQGAGPLILIDRDDLGMLAVADGLPDCWVEMHVCDVSNEDDIRRVFGRIEQEHGTIDYLFNSAGIQAGQPAWPDAELERIRAVIEVNVLGLMFATNLAIPLMKAKGGSILNLASVSGLKPYLSGAVYGPSKAAVILFTQANESLAKLHGIRVNALCPGMVDTPFLTKTGHDGKIAPWLQEKLDAGDVLAARTVACAAIDLACDKGKTGQYVVLEAHQA